MPRATHAAFLSYSSVYREWVEALHAHLEATLQRHGESRPIFLDRVELELGRSWVSQLEAGLDQAAKLILVITPEAMASPWVGSEWQALVAKHPHWNRGLLIPVMLVWAPLPLFLGPIQYLDVRGHDGAGYAEALRKLTGALLDLPPRRARQLDLPPGLTPPPAPTPAIPESDLRDLLARLAPEIADEPRRRALAAALGCDVAEPRDYGGVDSAASAWVVEVGAARLNLELGRLRP